jgi:hypothetical protein
MVCPFVGELADMQFTDFANADLAHTYNSGTHLTSNSHRTYLRPPALAIRELYHGIR